LLSPPDLDLVRRDPDLPGLATVLDPPVMLAALRGLHPGIDDALIFYTRYKPHTSCLIGYRLKIGAEQVEIGVHARRADAANKFAKAKLRLGIGGALGAGRHVIDDLATELSVFPNDRRLPGLVHLSNATSARALLNALGADDPTLRDSRIEKLRYRPERRYVLKVVQDDKPLALTKIYRPADYARSRDNALAFVSQGDLRVPNLLATAEQYDALATEWLPGMAPAATAASATRIGETLALLHAQQPSGLSPLPLTQQLRTLEELIQYLAALWPPLARQAQQVGLRLATAMAGADDLSLPIHGDFHLEQMIETDAAMGVVDFDDASMGNPAWDLGNIIGHLHGHDLRDGRQLADGFGEPLLIGYQRAGGRVSVADMKTYSALGLMRFAARPFRERHPAWPERIAGILSKVDALLGEVRPAKPATPTPIDPAMPSIEAALDCTLAAQKIDLNGLGPGIWRISEAKLTRHKPGRRCLIEYLVNNDAGETMPLLGKMRARGADERCFAVQQILWHSGFGADADDAIMVPEPVAIAPELSLWLQRKVAGAPFAVTPDRAAEAIAKLHRAPIKPVRRHSLSDEMQILQQRLSALAERQPQWRDRVMRLGDAASRLALQARPARQRTIHRDFYHDHLLCDGKAVHIIDLDLFCLGDPAVDIGNYTAHLIELGLRTNGNADHERNWRLAFEHHYRQRVGDVAPENIHIYEILSLMRLIEISDRMPERRGATEALIACCEDRVGVQFHEKGKYVDG
jgi:aminoglycoside phosphotransferase (APT) family kinase protein